MQTRLLTVISKLPAINLLQAIGMPANGQGLALALPALQIYIEPTCRTWSTTAAVIWGNALIEAQAAIRTATLNGADTSIIFDSPALTNDVYSTFLRSKAPVMESGSIHDTYSLLGRGILIAASKRQTLSPHLVSGIGTLRNAIQGKGKRATDWARLAKISLLDPSELKEFHQSVDRTSPVLQLLESMIQVLETPILPPSELHKSGLNTDTEASVVDQKNAIKAIVEGTTDANEKVESNSDSSVNDDTIPDIGARLKGADYLPYSMKLGLHHRDQLLVADLVPVTHMLMAHLQSNNPLHIGYAMLALVSLITCSSDSVALKLEFQAGQTIWIDLERCCWAWDFQFYRNSKNQVDNVWNPADIEPIYIPFPSALILKLQQVKLNHPDAKNLHELILAFTGQPSIELRDYRQFLRGCGSSSAHPAYQGRFSRTLPSVYLEVTGSDMTCALVTGHPAASGPAALYYFGPSHQVLQERIVKVYTRLGLGDVADMPSPLPRSACQKILELPQLQQGWAELVQDINLVRHHAFASHSQIELIKHCDQWMQCLTAGFVIMSGHRGTRLECLSFGALLRHPHAMLIQDKDDAGHAQPRLLPRTLVVNALLLCAIECHQLMHTRVHDRQNGNSFSPAVNTLVFGQWPSNPNLPLSPVTTKMVAEITQHYFKGEANFGRSQWVTYLDEFNCDRWLIRVLTGHAREVTRTNGAYLDLPPLISAIRLGHVMDEVGIAIFGSKHINVGRIARWNLSISIEPVVDKNRGLSDRVLDPRTLLAPVTVSTLTGWKTTEEIRRALTHGEILATPQTLAVLHLIFMDQVPDLLLCVIAVCSPDEPYFKKYGQQVGILWQREHFVHETWIPIQPATARLLDLVQADATKQTPMSLMSQVQASLKNITGATWPKNGCKFWEALADITQAWRRLELAPHLAILSDPTVPTPCLSSNSLRRLAGEKVVIDEYIYRPARPENNAKGVIGDDLRALTKILNYFSSTLERLGEKRQRAINCTTAIGAINIPWSLFGSWMRDWILEELARTKNNLNGCYQISSLSTYLCTLIQSTEDFDYANDPEEWEDDEWMTWVKMIDTLCGASPSKSSVKDDVNALTERAKNALNALLYSLRRRQENVPRCITDRTGIEPTSKRSGSSASSTLIRTSDTDAALALLLHWHYESPVEASMDRIRVLVASSVPVRSSDISSLKTNCLTPAGGLDFSRAGYNQHKNPNAIRVAELEPHQTSSLASHIDTVRRYVGEQPLLMRCDGSLAMGLRDQRLARDFGSALKATTGDPHARFHSLRAATLQNICWPGWEQLATKLMSSDASVQDCNTWIQQLQADWTRCAKAASMAGHADLRSAIGNYMSGWSLIYAIVMNAKLNTLVPGPRLLIQLGLRPDTLRQEKSRTTRKGDQFCSWSWISEQLEKKSTPITVPKNVQTNITVLTEDTPPIGTAPVPCSGLSALIYLTVRALRMTHEASLENTDLPLSVANRLNALMPGPNILDEVDQRARAGAQDRAKVANIAMALSPTGRAILDWLSALTVNIRRALHGALFRIKNQVEKDARSANFWRAVAANLPQEMCVQLRIGAAHANGKLQADFLTLSPAVLLITDPRIGASPMVSIVPRDSQNRVVSSRLSSVTRAASLAFDLLNLNED